MLNKVENIVAKEEIAKVSNFTFGHSVFKSRLLLLLQNASAGGKGLTWLILTIFQRKQPHIKCIKVDNICYGQPFCLSFYKSFSAKYCCYLYVKLLGLNDVFQPSRVVVVISIVKFPGGVFTLCPYSSYVNTDGQVAEFTFGEWKEAMMNPLRGN